MQAFLLCFHNRALAISQLPITVFGDKDVSTAFPPNFSSVTGVVLYGFYLLMRKEPAGDMDIPPGILWVT